MSSKSKPNEHHFAAGHHLAVLVTEAVPQTAAKQSHLSHWLTVCAETFDMSNKDKDGTHPNAEFLSRSGLLGSSAEYHVNLGLYATEAWMGGVGPTLWVQLPVGCPVPCK
jgi:hypothetical protein